MSAMPIDSQNNYKYVFNSERIVSCFGFPFQTHKPFGKEILKLLHWSDFSFVIKLDKRICRRCLQLLSCRLVKRAFSRLPRRLFLSRVSIEQENNRKQYKGSHIHSAVRYVPSHPLRSILLLQQTARGHDGLSWELDLHSTCFSHSVTKTSAGLKAAIWQ